MQSHLESREPASAPELIIGRLLIGSLFLIVGIRKIANWTATLSVFSKLGVPMVEVVLPLVVLVELAGGLLIVFGWCTRWVAYALAAFTLGAGLIGHAFWSADAEQFGNQLNHFLKNLAICGGLVCVASIYRRPKK